MKTRSLARIGNCLTTTIVFLLLSFLWYTLREPWDVVDPVPNDYWNNVIFTGIPSQPHVQQELEAAIIAFSDLSITRVELQTRLEKVCRHLQPSKPLSQARGILATLGPMITEEASVFSDQPLIAQDSVTSNDAASLLFKLRDQNGLQETSPGARVILDLGPADSAARKLVSLGLEGVPQLINAIDDKRLTRTV